ncbi:MAG: hypothetical protein GY708_01595 [Actinomycetia bacterium]|nr:hypothetical protein [Actinomycetes bacterium]
MSDVCYEFKPRPGYTTAYTAGMLAMFGLLSLIMTVSPVIVVAGTCGAVFGISRQRVRFNSTGMVVGRRSAGWNELHLRRGRFLDTLHTPKGTPFGRRTGATLQYFVKDWRNSRLASSMSEWAPHTD